METKYITIPFQVERAKRISNGEEEGKIVTRDGRNARIVCWDVKNQYSILALVPDISDYESPLLYQSTGLYYAGEQNNRDLFLSVPEWTTFKDGDIVTMGWEDCDHYCKWISIIKVIDVFDNDICTRDYVSFCLEADNNDIFQIDFNSSSDAAKWIRTSTEEEIHKLIEGLKESKDPKAKEYFKRFFGIEEKKECEFKTFDKVLVRDDNNKKWIPGFFWSKGEEFYGIIGGTYWKQCVPYEGNEHLLGTSNDPE